MSAKAFSETPLRVLMACLAPYLRRELWRVLAVGLAMFVLGISGAGLAFLSGPAIALVFGADTGTQLQGLTQILSSLPQSLAGCIASVSTNTLVAFVPALLVMNAIIKGCAQACQFYLLGCISLAVQQALRRDTFKALLRQSPSFFAHHRQGDLLSRLTSDLTAVEQAIFYGLGSLWRDTLAVFVLVILLVRHDPYLSIWLFAAIPLSVWPLKTFGRWLKRAAGGGQKALGGVTSVCHEALLGLTTIQANQQEQRQINLLDEQGDAYQRHMRKSYAVRALRTPTMEVLGSLGTACAIFALARRAQSPGGDAAHYITFLTGMILLYDPLKKLGQISDFLQVGAASLSRLEEILSAQTSVTQKKDATALASFSRGVSFERVCFSYQKKIVIQDVSFHISCGQTVALVGASGAGKSTLAQLLCRYWDVDSGRICIDGYDLRDLTLNSLRSLLSVVGQETFLFGGTVGENIAYGRPDASSSQIEQAARSAGLEQFIVTLPKGFDTPIGERAADLSGGQKQRMSLARAFLRDTPLLLLDEATSQLDADSEQHVQQALARLAKSRTTLVIAHRLSTVRTADQIIVLHDGHVVEQGNHATLITQQGSYARWVSLQQVGHDGKV